MVRESMQCRSSKFHERHALFFHQTMFCTVHSRFAALVWICGTYLQLQFGVHEQFGPGMLTEFRDNAGRRRPVGLRVIRPVCYSRQSSWWYPRRRSEIHAANIIIIIQTGSYQAKTSMCSIIVHYMHTHSSAGDTPVFNGPPKEFRCNRHWFL